jgi:hypothetical protein
LNFFGDLVVSRERIVDPGCKVPDFTRQPAIRVAVRCRDFALLSSR